MGVKREGKKKKSGGRGKEETLIMSDSNETG